MASTNADRQPGKRRWRWVRLGLWAIALLWFAHYTYVRITTPPAAVSGQQQDVPNVIGRHDELLGLIQELPFAPAPAQAPSQGWWGIWSTSALAAGLLDEWAPDPNSTQDSAAKYINNPSTGKTLDRIVAWCAQHEQSPEENDRPARAPPTGQPAQYPGPRHEDAIAALAFRARYRTAEQAYLEGALADLRAAARIATIQGQSRSRWMWGVTPGATLVQYELGCLTREVDLSPDLAREMIGYLTDKLSLSVADVVIARTSADMQVDRLLDRYYTDDGRGNGWLVLSAASEQMTLMYGSPATARSRAWNIFSPLFSDRRTVRAKLLGLTDDLGQLDGMNYQAAKRFLADRPQSGAGGSVLDGPLFELTQGVDEYTFQQLFEQVARRRALVVMLALSAHKHARGAYPDALDSLRPDFLSEVPLDALTRRPFRYEQLPEGDYDLGPGTIKEETTGLFHNWWTPPQAYRHDSYVPQRTPEANPNQP